MRKSIRKSIGLLVALAMLVTLMPMGAFAEDVTEPTTVTLTPEFAVNVIGSEHSVETVGWPTSGADRFVWQLTGNLNGSYDCHNPGPLPPGMLEQGVTSAGERYIIIKADTNEPTYISLSWYKGDTRLGTAQAEKKWAQITRTVLEPEQGRTQIVWNENEKRWESEPQRITETVYGVVHVKDGLDIEYPIANAVVDWTLATEPVDGAIIVQSGTTSHTATTDSNGQAYIDIVSDVEGTTVIETLAHYPQPYLDQEHPTVPERAIWSWYTIEAVKTPYVNWAGEQRVLEKRFGEAYAGYPVTFVLENQSPGAFEDYGGWAQTVWTTVDDDGVARATLVSETQGEVDAEAILYDREKAHILNKHGFVVFYQKFEDIKLGNVIHSLDPGNKSTDKTRGTHNVTEEQLLRARVRGWFMGDNLSSRPAKLYSNGTVKYPAGRWILPDDWAKLAMGEKPADPDDWEAFRAAWDIHDDVYNIFNDIDGPDELGPFNGAPYPVIGPYDPLRPETLLADGELDKWDAPMPPAKMSFKIVDRPSLSDFDKDGIKGNDPYEKDRLFYEDIDWNGSGYVDYTERVSNEPGRLYTVDKGSIYVNSVTRDGIPRGDGHEYYAPFYKTLIPNNKLIPPFVNNGGYNWNSWDERYATVELPDGRRVLPYDFWTIFNSDWAYNHLRRDIPKVEAWGPTPYAEYPKEVQVYSDEHGEAMVWLTSGDGFDLSRFVNSMGGYEPRAGQVVGVTQARVYADYPYFRKHAPVYSYKVTKTWLSQWSKQLSVEVLDAVQQKVTATLVDIHGNPIVGEEIRWTISGQGFILDVAPGGTITSSTQATSYSDESGQSWIIIDNGAGSGGTNATYVKAYFPAEKVKRDTWLSWPTK